MGKLWVIEGKLGGSGPLVVEGWIEGTVRTPGRFELLPGARGSGTVEAEVARIEGRFSGRITASERIELVAGSVVEADLVAPRIVVEEGALFHGKVQMGREVAAPQQEEKPVATQREVTPAGEASGRGAASAGGASARGTATAGSEKGGQSALPGAVVVSGAATMETPFPLRGETTAQVPEEEREESPAGTARPAEESVGAKKEGLSEGSAAAVEALGEAIAHVSLPEGGGMRTLVGEGGRENVSVEHGRKDVDSKRVSQERKPRREPPLPPASAFHFGAMKLLGE